MANELDRVSLVINPNKPEQLEQGLDMLNNILQNLSAKKTLLSVKYGQLQFWFKIDVSEPSDVQVLYGDRDHRAMLEPFIEAFKKFLSQSKYGGGELLDYDNKHRLSHSERIEYPHEISQEFIAQAKRIPKNEVSNFTVLSVKPQQLEMQKKSASTAGMFGFFSKFKKKEITPPEKLHTPTTGKGPQQH